MPEKSTSYTRIGHKKLTPVKGGGGGVRTLWSDVVQIKTKKVPIPGSGMPVMPADFLAHFERCC